MKKNIIILMVISLVGFTGCKQTLTQMVQKESALFQESGKQMFSWKLLNSANVGHTNFVIIDPNAPEIVYAGIDVGGLYVSHDYGNHWMPSNRGLNWPADRLVAALTIDRKKGTLYLGVGGFDKGGIFKSIDHGASWQLLTREVKFGVTGIEQTRGKGLIVMHPSDSKTIYAGSFGDGLFKSADGGMTWWNLGLKNKHISSVVISPSNPQIIYVAVVKMSDNDGGIYKSVDGGGKWNRIGDKILDVYQLEMDYTDHNIIYAACGSKGIFKTEDGGSTWIESNKGLGDLEQSGMNSRAVRYISLSIDPINPDVIYAGSGSSRGHIYKSVDGGTTWSDLTENINNIYPDGWWIQELNWPGGSNYSANCISVDYKNNNRIYVSGRSGIWKTEDGGMTWHAQFTGLEGAGMLSIAIHPYNPKIFFVGETDYLMFRTLDGGNTFDRPLKGIGNWDLKESRDIWRKYRASEGLVFAIDPRKLPGTVYLGTAGTYENTGTIFKSTDGGETWREANRNLPVARVTALSTDQTNYDILFAILQDKGLYKTVDGGGNWEKIDIKVKTQQMFTWKNSNLIIIHPRYPDNIFILDKGNGVYRTINGGRTWEVISQDLPADGIRWMDQRVGGLAVDYTNPDVAYVGLRNHGVYKTVDGGKNWRKVTPSHILHGGVISIDEVGGSIYVASSPASVEEDIEGFIPGIYRSDDGGKNWFPIHNDELLNISLKVTFMTVNKGKIYIATQGNGIIIGEPKAK